MLVSPPPPIRLFVDSPQQVRAKLKKKKEVVLNPSSTTTVGLSSFLSLGLSFLTWKMSVSGSTHAQKQLQDDTLTQRENKRQWTPLVVNRTPGGRPAFQGRPCASPAPSRARAQPPPGCVQVQHRSPRFSGRLRISEFTQVKFLDSSQLDYKLIS